MSESTPLRDDGATRRDFLAAVSAAAAVSALGLPVRAEEPPAKEKRSRVVLVRDEKALDEKGKPDGEVIQQMLDKGMCSLLEVENVADAWKKLFKPEDRAGIKSNVWTFLPTPPQVVKAIRGRIAEVGIDEKSIVVDDRGARTTMADCTALVNARPLRTHHWSGIGGCIKNPIMFVENPEQYHPDMCADLATLWDLPILKGKVRLNVLVALTPQFLTRGPHHFDARYVWPYRGIFLSLDPVAVDATGVRLLEVKRREHFGEDRPLSALAKHVRIADERHHLGVADPKRIDLVKIGWEQDALI